VSRLSTKQRRARARRAAVVRPLERARRLRDAYAGISLEDVQRMWDRLDRRPPDFAALRDTFEREFLQPLIDRVIDDLQTARRCLREGTP
jgi:hypothetical protein